MTQKQLKRANEIQKELEYLSDVLSFCHPEKYVCLTIADINIHRLKWLCEQYEDEICDLFIKHKHKLEKELEEL